MSTVHEEDKPHLCYCDKSYNTMNSLKKHVKLVHEKPFDNKQSLKEGVCSICDKFHRKHEKTKTFECSECNRNFENKCALKQHANSAHEGKNLVECYKFSHEIGMIICHMAALNQEETPNKCLNCGKSFSSYYCLREHIELVHRGKEKNKD